MSLVVLVGPIVLVAMAGIAAQEAPAAPGPSHSTTCALDSLQVVGQFQYVTGGQALFGDSDHDGANEILLWAVLPTLVDETQILELGPNGAFVPVFEIPENIPLAIGDIDQDGRTDLVGQSGGISVREAITGAAHPSGLVWQVPAPSTYIGRALIADTDRDGRLEIVYLYYTDTLHTAVYECTADNEYSFRFRSPSALAGRATAPTRSGPSTDGPTGSQQPRDLLVKDLDGDGRHEIVFCDERLRVFESFGDDSWTQTFEVATSLLNTKIVAGGEDTDGNGRREVWVAGDDEPNFERRIYIYEPIDDHAFECVDTLTTNDGQSGGQSGTLAHLDYDGRWRFIWAVVGRLEVYSRVAGAGWHIERIIPDPSGYRLHAYAADLNRNGRDELYWVTEGRTRQSLVLERPTSPSDIGSDVPLPTRVTLRVSPTPARGFASVFLDASLEPRVRNWSIFDASGRLVLTQRVGRDAATGAWTMPVDRIRPGLYFLRANDATGAPLATGRVTIVR